MKSKNSQIDGQNAGLPKGCLVAFGVLFLFAGLVGFWFSLLRPTIQTMRAASWPTTQATITHCKIEESRDSDGSSYKPVIHFTYNVNGQQHTSKTWTFSVWSASHKWAQRVTDRFPIGSQHDCFYNPQSPDQAILDRNFQWINLLGLFTLIFAGIGGAILWYVWFGAEQLSTNDTTESAFTEKPWTVFEGPQRLKPVTSRLARFLGTLFLAAFWNTLSWFMFINVIQDQGWLSFPGIFLTVFVLVGAGLIFASLYAFLILFNPTVSVALSSGAVAIGETVDIAWEFEGNTGRIADLTIEMVGKETAIYRRGTSTSTDHKEFQRVPVVKTSDPATIQFGSLSLQVPADTMHTFLAVKNKIEWTIEVRGVIRWWPDVSESLPFYVKPVNTGVSTT